MHVHTYNFSEAAKRMTSLKFQTLLGITSPGLYASFEKF